MAHPHPDIPKVIQNFVRQITNQHWFKKKYLGLWIKLNGLNERRYKLFLYVTCLQTQFRYTFYIPQTKRLRAHKIGSQYKIRKGRKQIWGRFSNPWNSNGIEWNRLILLTWSRILMYLPNTVGKRHKKAFKFIFGDRNLRLRDSAFVRCAPQQMMTEMT